MAKNRGKRRPDDITPSMSAAFTMFALLAYNLAIRFPRLVDSAPGIVLLTAAAVFAAAGSLWWLVRDKNLPRSRRDLLYLLLAFAEIAVLVAFFYGADGS